PRFEGFSGVGVSGAEASFMRFSLDQRLQAKLKRGERIERLDNLLSWSLSGSYNFLAETHPLSTIASIVRLQPPGFMNGDLSWTNDFYQPRIVRSLSYNLNMYLSGGQTPI